MGLGSFSVQLSRGLAELDPTSETHRAEAGLAEPALAGLSLPELRRLVRDAELSFQDQDRIWAAVLRSYRRGPRAVWAPLVLELLAPALVEITSGFEPNPPAVDADDLQQQVALEALRAAGSIPLQGGRFIKPWLVGEVRRRISRWLEREARHGGGVAIDEVAWMGAGDEDEAWEMSEVLASHPRRQDLELLYRLEVAGETLGEVAQDFGCTPNAVECRRRRARSRIRRQLSSEDRYRTQKGHPTATVWGRSPASGCT